MRLGSEELRGMMKLAVDCEMAVEWHPMILLADASFWRWLKGVRSRVMVKVVLFDGLRCDLCSSFLILSCDHC